MKVRLELVVLDQLGVRVSPVQSAGTRRMSRIMLSGPQGVPTTWLFYSMGIYLERDFDPESPVTEEFFQCVRASNLPYEVLDVPRPY